VVQGPTRPPSGMFTAVESLIIERMAFSGAPLLSGQVLVVGGISGGAAGDTETCELYTSP
jgi:hypothetical protein